MYFQDECLKFEEIKRRLKELAPSEPSADGDARSQPVKKSRPLVLATANNAAVQSSKTKKSSGGQPAASEQSQSSGMTQQVKKGRPTSNGPVRSGGIESLPGSPRPRSPAYGAAASPRLSADYSSHMHSDDREDRCVLFVDSPCFHGWLCQARLMLYAYQPGWPCPA